MIIKNALSNTSTKTWVVIGIGVAGILIYSETRRRRNNQKAVIKEDFGAFVHRFEILPFPQPPPPAARLPLSGLSFAVNDNFDIKEYVSGFGNPDWEKTHDPAAKSALVVTWMLKNGATFVGKTVMDELAFGITGENLHYGTPTNPLTPSHIPGGSSSGSAVAVAAKLVDFAIGTDTLGCVRTPASFCGILGYRPSHGAVSSIGVLPNAQSLDTIGLYQLSNYLISFESMEWFNQKLAVRSLATPLRMFDGTDQDAVPKKQHVGSLEGPTLTEHLQSICCIRQKWEGMPVELVKDCSVTFFLRSHYGLLGINGTGKITFLRYMEMLDGAP